MQPSPSHTIHPTNRHRFALALLIISPALWAVNYLVARSAPGVIEPHLLASLRWLMAAVLFSLGNWGELRLNRAQIAQDWKHYLGWAPWACGFVAPGFTSVAEPRWR